MAQLMQITLGANSKQLQARKLRERGDEKSNHNARLTHGHKRFVSRGLILKNLLPIEEAT
jgi:hypothetical protein